MSFEIKFAKKEEVSDILYFIKELAKYENMLDEVTATPELLEKWIFEEKKANVVFAYEDDKKVGFTLYFTNFSTFLGKPGLYLEDLFVLPDYRGKGYGKALLKHLADFAAKSGFGRMEWACLNWNTPSIDFYLGMGAKRMTEWNIYRLTGKTLEDMANK